MLRLIIFLLFLVLSVWIGVEAVRHPGYMLVVYQPWMVQTPLWFAVLVLVIFILLFYLLIASIDRVHLLGYRIKNWFRFRRENQFYSKTQQGLTALIECQWKRAEQLLLLGTNQTLEPLINYLGAAKAAHHLGAFDKRDRYIQDAHKIAPKADLAIGLIQAELQIQQHQYEQAQATLNHLREISPRHPRVLKLLERVYVHLGDWPALKDLLPVLRKVKVITPEQTELFEKNIYCELFREASLKNLEQLQAMWNDVPRAMKKNPDVVYEYVTQLSRFGAHSEMEALVRKTLQHHWHAGLVNLYATLPFDNLNRQLVIVGAWLKTYGPKQALLLLLGKLCVRVQLWGKARDYFDKCLAIAPCPDASLAYGDLLQQLGEQEAATQKYREGLLTSTSISTDSMLK